MTDRTTTSGPEPTRVPAETYRRIVQLQQTIDALADETEDAFIHWGFPLADAAEARDALRTAPCLADIPPLPPGAEPLPDATPESLADLTRSLYRELIVLSEAVSDPLDRYACANSALFLGRLHESLR